MTNKKDPHEDGKEFAASIFRKSQSIEPFHAFSAIFSAYMTMAKSMKMPPDVFQGVMETVVDEYRKPE